uniref:VM domain-containing protein n=1 Tax=Parastrongyloides trichosuri TaxID=131310 RepID=A0A0N4ZA60_PARTI
MVYFNLAIPLLAAASSVNGFLWGSGCCSYGYYPQQSYSYAYQPPTISYMRVPIYAKITNLPSYPQPIQQYASPYASPSYSQPQQYGSSYQSVDMSTLYVQPGVNPSTLTNVILYDKPTNNYVTAPRAHPIGPVTQTPTGSYDPYTNYETKSVISTGSTEVGTYQPQTGSSYSPPTHGGPEPAGTYNPGTEGPVPYNPATEPPYNPVTEAPYNPVTHAPYNPVTESPYNPVTQAPSSYTSKPYNPPSNPSPYTGTEVTPGGAPGINEPYKKKI